MIQIYHHGQFFEAVADDTEGRVCVSTLIGTKRLRWRPYDGQRAVWTKKPDDAPENWTPKIAEWFAIRAGVTSRVYRYGLLAPTQNADAISDQIRGAHRFYNTLVEIERLRRQTVATLLATHGDTETLETKRSALSSQIDTLVARLRAAKKKPPSETKPSPLSNDEVKTMRADLKRLRVERKEIGKQLKEIKARIKNDPEIRRGMAAATERAQEAAKNAYGDADCAWGTRLITMEAVKAAGNPPARKRKPGVLYPQFRRWRPDGSLAVQTQEGLPVQDVYDDRRFQIDRVPQPVPTRSGKPRTRGKPLPRIRLRIGSEGRDPVWAEWPIVMHRPLPTEGRIKWVRVCRRRVGTHDRWSLHVTVELPADWRRESCGAGVVAIDLGWRQRPGGLRVAFAGDEANNADELIVAPEVTSGFERARTLRKTRDKSFDEAVALLSAWLKANEHPEWLRDETAHLAQWRATSRLAKLTRQWRNRRFEGDAEIYRSLERWRKQDRHLYEWETHARRKAGARRKDLYRRWAAKLARTYSVLVLEDFDLSKMAQRPGPDDEQTHRAGPARQRVYASPHELRDCLVDAFRSRGGTVVSESAVNTTRECHACGSIETFDAAAYVTHRCTACRTVWDQDDNAARNLLARYRERLGGAGSPGPSRSKHSAPLGPDGSNVEGAAPPPLLSRSQIES